MRSPLHRPTSLAEAHQPVSRTGRPRAKPRGRADPGSSHAALFHDVKEQPRDYGRSQGAGISWPAWPANPRQIARKRSPTTALQGIADIDRWRGPTLSCDQQDGTDAPVSGRTAPDVMGHKHEWGGFATTAALPSIADSRVAPPPRRAPVVLRPHRNASDIIARRLRHPTLADLDPVIRPVRRHGKQGPRMAAV